MKARIVVDVEIDDPNTLHAKVGSDHCLANSLDDDAFETAVEMFGPSGDPNVEACLESLLDVNHPEATVRVVSCEAKVQDATTLAQSTYVTVSILHLTEGEAQRITDAFGFEQDGDTYRGREDIRHDGLCISPRIDGFIVRVPSEESLPDKLPGMTPEMRAVVQAAVRQGARRIEFDVEEDAIDGLPYFER